MSGFLPMRFLRWGFHKGAVSQGDNRELIFKMLDLVNPTPHTRRSIEIAYNSKWRVYKDDLVEIRKLYGLGQYSRYNYEYIIKQFNLLGTDEIQIPFELTSDGISWVMDFEFDYPWIRHPCGVAHDFLYRAGEISPFWKIKWDDSDGRFFADKWFKQGVVDFHHPYRAQYMYYGLRWFGRRAWLQNRSRDANTKERLIIGRCEQ